VQYVCVCAECVCSICVQYVCVCAECVCSICVQYVCAVCVCVQYVCVQYVLCSVPENLSVCRSLECLGRLKRFGLRIAGEVRELHLFRNVQPASGSFSAFHSMGTGFCPSGKPEGGGTKNEWSYTSTVPYAFVARTGTSLNLLL
jgi:hypothetical protein